MPSSWLVLVLAAILTVASAGVTLTEVKLVGTPCGRSSTSPAARGPMRGPARGLAVNCAVPCTVMSSRFCKACCAAIATLTTVSDAEGTGTTVSTATAADISTSTTTVAVPSDENLKKEGLPLAARCLAQCVTLTAKQIRETLAGSDDEAIAKMAEELQKTAPNALAPRTSWKDLLQSNRYYSIAKMCEQGRLDVCS